VRLHAQARIPFARLRPNDPQYAEWVRRATDWRLMLQLDSDETNSDMLWGDAGLHYWFAGTAICSNRASMSPGGKCSVIGL
jgi:uncharacterized protein YwqG